MSGVIPPVMPTLLSGIQELTRVSDTCSAYVSNIIPRFHPTNDRRKFKGRIVFQGNRVVNQTWEQAVFDDLGSNPAILEVSRCSDANGCSPGNRSEIGDA